MRELIQRFEELVIERAVLMSRLQKLEEREKQAEALRGEGEDVEEEDA